MSNLNFVLGANPTLGPVIDQLRELTQSVELHEGRIEQLVGLLESQAQLLIAQQEQINKLDTALQRLYDERV